MVNYALKRGLPDAFAYKAKYYDCHSKKFQLYLLHSIQLKSSVGIDEMSMALKDVGKHEESILFDSTYSTQGCKQCSYSLYVLYSKGEFYENWLKTGKKYINPNKAKFYYQRALEQEHITIMYQEALKVMPDDRERAYQYLIRILEILEDTTAGLSPIHIDVVQKLQTHFPTEWKSYSIKKYGEEYSVPT